MSSCGQLKRGSPPSRCTLAIDSLPFSGAACATSPGVSAGWRSDRDLRDRREHGLAGAAVMSSVNVQQGTHRDGDSKSAIAAADAGANVALLRLNRYASAFSTATPCLGAAGAPSSQLPAAMAGAPPVGGDGRRLQLRLPSTPSAVGSS